MRHLMKPDTSIDNAGGRCTIARQSLASMHAASDIGKEGKAHNLQGCRLHQVGICRATISGFQKLVAQTYLCALVQHSQSVAWLPKFRSLTGQCP